MDIYYLILLFVIGCIFGSFFYVVGSRLPRNESIVYPSSHCTNCGHVLTPVELIPIISFLIQGGKCKKCGIKLSWFYPFYEFASGIMYALAYLSFGFTFDLVIAITFISCILIIIASDVEYMIIPDEVLIFFTGLLLIEIFMNGGLSKTLYALLNGAISFAVMFGIKKLGDLIFKKESMGGGDIKLLFVFGLVLGWGNALLSIFIGSFIGLPISLFLLLKKKSHEIPFGPFLGIGAIVILLLNFDVNALILFLTS